MTTKINIFEQGLEEYPKSSIILGNLAFAIIMVGVVLRKLVCTNCYYYGKWCSTGWGKLSALLFKKGNVEAFDTSIGVKLAPVTYGLLVLIPLILLVISVVQGFTVPKITVLILLLLVSSYSGIISRKKACTNCKMRLVCPGCAVKEMSSAQV